MLRRNAALAVVQGPLHTAPSSTAAPMQLMVRPRSSAEQDTTASKCRRSPCCYWCGEKTYTNLAMPARAASHSAYLDALASDHENPCLNFNASDKCSVTIVLNIINPVMQRLVLAVSALAQLGAALQAPNTSLATVPTAYFGGNYHRRPDSNIEMLATKPSRMPRARARQ